MDVAPWEYVVIAICLMLSAFFSASETALTALGETKVRQLVEGAGGSHPLRLWLDHPDRVLSTLLLGNNLVNIGGSTLAVEIAAQLGLPHAVALTTGVMTFLVLVFGEITPKTFAKAHAESVARMLMPLVVANYWVLFPLAAGLLKITRGIGRVFHLKIARMGPSVTGAEIEYLIDLGTREGVLDKVKEELLNSVLEFADILVKEVMSPRTKMVALDRAATYAEVMGVMTESEHSRIPVYDNSIDNVIGVLYAKDVVAELHKGNATRESFNLDRFIKPPFFVPELMKISRLLKEFQKRKTHIAIVVDEFGGTSGIVALEDVIEEIVGEIQDEYDVDEKPVKIVASGVYLADGAVPLRDLAEVLGTELPGDGDYETLGGFLTAHAGKVPPPGSLVVWRDLNFTVRGSDEKRILKVEITRKAADRSETTGEMKAARADGQGVA